MQVRRSHKFGKILELILLMGNIMNTGSRNEQSVGFDISYLPKLSNTKDRDNKRHKVSEEERMQNLKLKANHTTLPRTHLQHLGTTPSLHSPRCLP